MYDLFIDILLYSKYNPIFGLKNTSSLTNPQLHPLYYYICFYITLIFINFFPLHQLLLPFT